jgi:hypothetical protein
MVLHVRVVAAATGEAFPLSLDDAATLDDLRGLVERSAGVQPLRQRLIFAGRDLPLTPEPLAAVNIVDGSTLHLVVRSDEAVERGPPGTAVGPDPQPPTGPPHHAAPFQMDLQSILGAMPQIMEGVQAAVRQAMAVPVEMQPAEGAAPPAVGAAPAEFNPTSFLDVQGRTLALRQRVNQSPRLDIYASDRSPAHSVVASSLRAFKMTTDAVSALLESTSLSVQAHNEILGSPRDVLGNLISHTADCVAELSTLSAQLAASLRTVQVGRTPAEFRVLASPPPPAQAAAGAVPPAPAAPPRPVRMFSASAMFPVAFNGAAPPQPGVPSLHVNFVRSPVFGPVEVRVMNAWLLARRNAVVHAHCLFRSRHKQVEVALRHLHKPQHLVEVALRQ